MFDRRLFISIVGIIVVLGVGYMIVQKVIEEREKKRKRQEREKKADGDTTLGGSCPGNMIRENPPYGDCVCPEGTGGPNCRQNLICNKRAPVGILNYNAETGTGTQGYNPETKTCACIGMFEPYGHDYCRCPRDDINGVDMGDGVGYKENCCGPNGKMRKNTSSCECNDGWYGANCNIKKYIEESCQSVESECSNNVHHGDIICTTAGGHISACRYEHPRESGEFHTCFKPNGDILGCTPD